MPRQKVKRNFPKNFKATEEEQRFGTPIEVAAYRADRLKCNTLLEIGCGVGFQTLYFAKACKKVIAVDIDKERIEKAKENLSKHDISNVEFIIADALDPKFISTLKDIDIIFCDPGRPTTEKERRLSSLSPTLQELRNHYTLVCKDVAFEVPPFLKELPIDAEVEYLTLHGTLNRLTLYFNNLRQRTVSVLDIPSMERLEASDHKTKPLLAPPKFIGEVNNAVKQAQLEDALAKTGMVCKEEGKILILAKKPARSAFIRWYQVDMMKGSDIVLHYPVPEDLYKEEKRKFKLMKGPAPVHIFRVNGEFIPCSRCKTSTD